MILSKANAEKKNIKQSEQIPPGYVVNDGLFLNLKVIGFANKSYEWTYWLNQLAKDLFVL